MERVKQYFIARGGSHLIDRIHVFSGSSATVELAAQCLNCDPAHIAKSLSFSVKAPKSKAENRQNQKLKAAAAAGAKGGDATSPTSPASPASPASPTEGDAGSPIIIVAAGDAKVDKKKYKDKFGCKSSMFNREEVEAVVGYPAGGVCPFGVNPAVKVYLDVSLKRFEKVYPACGTGNTGIPLSCDELEKYADNFVEWVDLCEGWQSNAAASSDAIEMSNKQQENEVAKKEEA